MSSRLTDAASLLLILVALLVIFSAYRPRDAADPPVVLTETRHASPARVPESSLLAELFPAAAPSGKPERLLSPRPEDASDVPSGECINERHTGRKVGHIELAGGKEMVFVRSR